MGGNNVKLEPGTAEVQASGDAAYPWAVTLVRSDGSIRDVALCQERSEASRACQHVRDAVAADEEWVRNLIEVSTGQLRG